LNNSFDVNEIDPLKRAASAVEYTKVSSSYLH